MKAVGRGFCCLLSPLRLGNRAGGGHYPGTRRPAHALKSEWKESEVSLRFMGSFVLSTRLSTDVLK